MFIKSLIMNEMQILFVKDGKLADVSWSRHQLILLGLGLVRHMPFDGFKNYKILQAFIFLAANFGEMSSLKSANKQSLFEINHVETCPLIQCKMNAFTAGGKS